MRRVKGAILDAEMPKSLNRKSFAAVRQDLEERGLLLGVLAVIKAERSTLAEVCSGHRGKTSTRARREVYAYLRGAGKMSTTDVARVFGLDTSTVIQGGRTREAHLAIRQLAKTALERPTLDLLGEESVEEPENAEALAWLTERGEKCSELLTLARGVLSGRPVLSYVESASRMSALVLELLDRTVK